MDILKKNLSIILVILLTLLLVAMVIWVFNKRIESIGKEKSSSAVIHKTQTPLLASTLLNFHL